MKHLATKNEQFIGEIVGYSFIETGIESPYSTHDEEPASFVIVADSDNGYGSVPIQELDQKEFPRLNEGHFWEHYWLRQEWLKKFKEKTRLAAEAGDYGEEYKFTAKK